jgi:hypothetical protein
MTVAHAQTAPEVKMMADTAAPAREIRVCIDQFQGKPQLPTTDVMGQACPHLD